MRYIVLLLAFVALIVVSHWQDDKPRHAYVRNNEWVVKALPGVKSVGKGVPVAPYTGPTDPKE